MILRQSKSSETNKIFCLVKIPGNEQQIAQKIDSKLPQIKTKYHVPHNNQVAILCRGNGTVQLLDKLLQAKHKIYTETPLDSDTTEWGRFFKEILLACFSADAYAIDFAEQLFSEESDHEKFRHALSVVSVIFSTSPENMISVESNFINLAQMVYPQKAVKRQLAGSTKF